MWKFVKKCLFNIYFSSSIIIIGMLPVFMGDFILGFLMTFIPTGIMISAKRSCTPRSEWIVFSLILLLGTFALIYMFSEFLFFYACIVYSISFLITYFSLESYNFKKDKLKAQSDEKGNSFIIGEIPPPITLKSTDVSMYFYHGKQYLGSSVPATKHGDNFTFYGAGLACASLYTAENKYKFPFLFYLRIHELTQQSETTLRIDELSLWKVKVYFPTGDAVVIHLRRRKLYIAFNNGMEIQITLYHEGIIIKSNRIYDQKMELYIPCLSYFLWLQIFGYKRQDS